ncbi:MAG TPA: Rieske (2Fe-2S) protein [Planctomycetota bacterium]|nr:Rieske (2Fe-2S) protein [Planctomycetota bacterium]
MAFDPATWVRACTLEELKKKAVQRVRGTRPVVTVYYHGNTVSAIDNRCPHLGFPLDRGTVKDGVLTCHWHHADFDLCSGCTYNLFADDVPTYETHIEDGVIFVAPQPRRKLSKDDFIRRLHKGMDQNVAIIIAKSVDALYQLDPTGRTVILEAARFGLRRHNRAVGGMTNLSIAATLMPYLSPKTAFYCLYNAVKNIADNCSGQAPRMTVEELHGGKLDLPTLSASFRSWVEKRDVYAVQRVALQLARSSATIPEIASILLGSATDRIYGNDGHGFDLGNKGLELIEFLGREHAPDLLLLLIEGITTRKTGAEDLTSWRHPVDIITPLRAYESQLGAWMAEGRGKLFTQDAEQKLIPILLSDDALKILDAMKLALQSGCAPVTLAKLVAYAAVRRMAHFSTNNVIQDWFWVQHTHTYANAVHQALKRSEATPQLTIAIFHGAMSVYMDRFLNVPCVPLPGERQPLDNLPTDGPELLARLLKTLDQQSETEAAARTVARYVRLGHPLTPLIDTLAYATVREAPQVYAPNEGVDFHYWQALEAGVKQAKEWEGRPELEHIFVGVVRHLAAACPTSRGGMQIADVAQRLNRGAGIHEDGAE